jgi:hypothetical protein
MTTIDSNLLHLQPYLIPRVQLVLLELRSLGWDPKIIETRRSAARQAQLFNQGRLLHDTRPIVTWTRHSLHETGKAVDIIDDIHGFTNPNFFADLARAASHHGLHALRSDQCHIEWRG